MSALLTFGDIFKYEENDYVYLSQVDDILYVAKILNNVLTELVATRYQQIDSDRSRRSRLSDNPLFCFVMLTTPEYKDRMASLAKPGSNAGIDITATGAKLNEVDLKELLDTIKDAETLPRQLKDSVRTIRIS